MEYLKWCLACQDVINTENPDTDEDGVCDSDDPRPVDNPDDPDGDGVCTSDDVCPEENDNIDTDGDGIPDCKKKPADDDSKCVDANKIRNSAGDCECIAGYPPDGKGNCVDPTKGNGLAGWSNVQEEREPPLILPPGGSGPKPPGFTSEGLGEEIGKTLKPPKTESPRTDPELIKRPPSKKKPPKKKPPKKNPPKKKKPPGG